MQQQTDASARVHDVQPSGANAPEATADKAQSKRKASTGTKAQPKWHRATPSSPPQPMSSSQPDPADAPEQTIDPFDQGTSSAAAPKKTITLPTQGMSLLVIFQESTTDKATKKSPLFSALINSAAEDVPSVDLADPHQSIIQTASSSQRQEITLKQVSYQI